MNSISTRRRLLTVGVAIGAVVGTAGIASALSNSPTTPKPVVSSVPPATDAPEAADVDTNATADSTVGADTSNTDPAHEAAETPEQAAAEAAGKGHGHGHEGGGHHGHSNTDAAHEAAESPERQAQEAAEDAADATVTTTAG